MFELTLKMNRFPISEAKAQLLKIQSIPESDFKDYVLKKRQEIFDFHISENPFYQNFLSSKKITSWEDIPVMQKADLQKPLVERLSKGFSKKKFKNLGLSLIIITLTIFLKKH